MQSKFLRRSLAAGAFRCLLMFPIAAMLTSCASSPVADKPIRVRSAVPYLNDEVATAEVRQECPDWTTSIIAELVSASKGRVVVTDEDLNTESGQVLSLVITAVHAAGGSVFSGPKWAHLRGELKVDGTVIREFELNSGGVTPFHVTLCGTLERIGKVLGHRTAAQLRNAAASRKPHHEEKPPDESEVGSTQPSSATPASARTLPGAVLRSRPSMTSPGFQLQQDTVVSLRNQSPSEALTWWFVDVGNGASGWIRADDLAGRQP